MNSAVVNSRGQVTIPKTLRTELRISPGDLISFECVEGGMLLHRYDPDHEPSDWQYHVKYGPRFASSGQVMTAEEFMSWLHSVEDAPVATDHDAHV